MEGISSYFYAARVSDAADSIAGTAEYKEQARKELKLFDELKATFTEDQASLFDKWESESSELDCLTQDAIYKAGFLDGIAMGMTSATSERRIQEAEKSAFRLGYEEGKAVGLTPQF
jgi:hypothetical protein